MKMNFSKTKFILFNPTQIYDFQPGLTVGNNDLEYVDQMKLLGLTLTSDLKWEENTVEMVKKANKKLWMIKRLKKNGANLDDLKDVYFKQVRSVLEFGVPVWKCGITQEEISDIERVQKSFLYIALGNAYHSYSDALEKMEMETLADRRTNLCRTFALKASKHPKHRNWFKLNEINGVDTRSTKTKYKTPITRLSRFQNSPIPYLTSLLNKM